MRHENFQFSIFNFQLQKGQALVTLLIFMIVGITVTSAAVVILMTNSLAASKTEQGTTAYYVAESGAENALLRLLRDPSYTGETLPIDGATAISSVSVSGNTYTITSNATSGNFKSSIQVKATFASNIFTIYSWKEVF